MTSGFSGFPVAALDVDDDLEVDNPRSVWEQHRAVYDEAVRAPMLALTAALAPEFGEAKVFRPYRDVRFAKDKTPFKTHQGAFVPAGPSTGFYDATGPRIAAIRSAIDDDRTGRELESMIQKFEGGGWRVGGHTLKTAPRGYDVNHPRIELLRHKSLTIGHDYGFEPIIHTTELLEAVRDDWRTLRPLVEWVTEAE